MKKLVAIFSVLAFAAVAAIAAQGPETIDLGKAFDVKSPTKKAVMFPHGVHQKNNQCTDCHMDAKGGKDLKSAKGAKLTIGEVKGTSNALHKEFCWPCHEKKQVKAGKACNTCHK